MLFSCLWVNAGDKNKTGGLKLKTVVIDAGHGGHDPGALGKHIQEKEITLAIALKLGDLIKKNLPEVKVIYTRSTDVFIELKQRAEIANKNNADLFISIHVNSNPNINAAGVDTWVMGQYKNNENFQVAKSENKVILAESNYGSQYEGFDPNSTESYIIFNLMQNAFIGQSLEFATDVQQEVAVDGRKDRGVESAPFLVLWKTTMPSVLVETGFISNADDEKLLISEDGQIQMSNAIFRAFKDYKTKVDSRTKVSIFDQPKTTENSLVKETIKQDTTEKQHVSTETTSISEKTHTTNDSKPAVKESINSETKNNQSASSSTASNAIKAQTGNSNNLTLKESSKSDSKDKQPINTVTANNQDKTQAGNNNKPTVKEATKTESKEKKLVSTATSTESKKEQTQNNSKSTFKEFPKNDLKEQVKTVSVTTENKQSPTTTKPTDNLVTKTTPPTHSNEGVKVQNTTVNNKPVVKEELKTNKTSTKETDKTIPTSKDETKPIATSKPIGNESSKSKASSIVKDGSNEQSKSTNKTTFKEFPKSSIIEPIKESPNEQTQKTANPTVKKVTQIQKANSTDTNIYFAVQVLSSVKHIRLDSSIFKNFKQIREIKLAGVYKYLVGNELEYNNVVLLKNKTREYFPDAFVVAFKNGIKIPITEALEEKNKYKTK